MCEISESQWSALLQIIHKFFQTNKDANKRNVPVALCDDIFVVWFLDDHYFHFLASILNTEFIFLHSSSATLFNLKTFERDFFNKESALESQIDDVAQTDMEECDKHTFMNENLVGSSEISQIISSCLIPLMFSRFSRETSVCTLYDKKTFLSQAPVEYPGEFIDIHDDSVSQKHTVGNVLGEPLSFLNDVSITSNAQSSNFYEYLFVERSCSPLPLSVASLFPLFLNKMIIEHSMKFTLPIVLMVNDEGPELYNWNHLLTCFDENVTTEGIVEDAAETNNPQCPPDTSSIFTAVDCVEGDISFQNSATPAPIPRKLTAKDDDAHLLPHDAALWSFGSVESLTKIHTTDQRKFVPIEDTLNSSLLSHLNWSFFSRATHLCFLPTALGDTFQHELNKYATCSVNLEDVEFNQAVAENQQTDSNSHALNVSLATKPLFHYILVKVPVLPQEQMFFPLFSSSARKLVSLPIGNFLLKCLPDKIMHFTALVSSLKEEKPDEQQKKIPTIDAYTQKSLMNMLGSVTAKCRYDLIQNPPYFDKLYSLKEGSIERQLFCNRVGSWSVKATQGPLVSLEASWKINDAWTTTMYPFFPIPDTASFESNVLQSTISFRAGAGKDTYLFWMWSDLEILQDLRNIRMKLYTNKTDTQATEEFSENILRQPLHVKENIFFALYNASNESTLWTAKTDKSEPISHSYQPLKKNEILSHVDNFLKIQRHLGEATVKRRVGHIMNSTNLQGNDTHSLHLETRKTESVHPATSLYAETLQSNHGLFPPARSDTDFSDHLWHFIRRSFDTEDMLKVVEIVIDTIGSGFNADSSSTIHSYPLKSAHYVSSEQNELFCVPRESASLQKTQPSEQPFIPLLRNNSTPILKSLVQIAIKGSQLKRYSRSTSNFDAKTMYHPPSYRAPNKTSEDEARSVQESWIKSRAELTNPIHCIDLVCEIGIEALFRDATVIIQEADPSISLATLSWFKEVPPASDESLQRLSYLHKVSELAALARTVKLPWDTTRSLLRHAIELYKGKSSCEQLKNDPLFVLNLSRQQCRTMLDFWVRQESEVLLSLTVPRVLTAVFTRVKGELERRYLEKNYKLYPVNLAKPSDELSEEDTSNNAGHPVYLWKTVQRENSDAKQGATIENNKWTLNGTPPPNFSTDNQHILYSLKLIYYDPSL